jgi:tRNA (guanosine-2'-O-)-methyltransferase
MLIAACARALRHARPARPSLTRQYRQRVGASDEARLALKEYSEFGQEPIPESTTDEDVTLTGDAAVVRQAVEILAPYVSDERRDTFQRVVQQRTRHLSVAFERPSNPSNVWACLRTIDAFGCQDVHIVEDSLEEAAKRAAARGVHADPTQRMRGRKKRMTSAMGAQKWLSLEAHSDAQALVARLKSEGRIVAATDLSPGAVDFSEVDWASSRHALVFGNEEVGISEELRNLADVRVRLPMRGLAESLNLSVSVGAALAHVDAKGALVPDLTVEERDLLLLRWSLLSVRAGRELLRREGVELDQGVLKTRASVLGFTT